MTNSKNTYANLDTKIKNAFKLFEGKRSEEEDTKIYEKVYDLCFDETTGFLEDNLSFKDRDHFIEKLETLDKQSEGNEKKATELIDKYLKTIEHWQFKLDKRFDYFINQLVVSSLKKAKKNK